MGEGGGSWGEGEELVGYCGRHLQVHYPHLHWLKRPARQREGWGDCPPELLAICVI